MQALILSLAVLAAIAVVALLFVFWLIVVVLRGITRLLLGPGLKTQGKPPLRDPPHAQRCLRESCKGMNPMEARYCRRCGESLESPRRIAARVA
jgi:hypothetical protein